MVIVGFAMAPLYPCCQSLAVMQNPLFSSPLFGIAIQLQVPRGCWSLAGSLSEHSFVPAGVPPLEVFENLLFQNSLSNQHFLQATSSFKGRSEEHTSELQSRGHLVCRLLLEK